LNGVPILSIGDLPVDASPNGAGGRWIAVLFSHLLFVAVATGQCQAGIQGAPSQTLSCGTALDGSASNGTGPYTYSWSPAAGLSDANIADPIVIASGTYTLTITDANNCTDVETVTVTITPLAQMADAGSDRTKCQGETITITPPNGGVNTANNLNGTAPYTYSWSPTTGLSDHCVTALFGDDQHHLHADRNRRQRLHGYGPNERDDHAFVGGHSHEQCEPDNVQWGSHLLQVWKHTEQSFQFHRPGR
jgi:hypothetical protein